MAGLNPRDNCEEVKVKKILMLGAGRIAKPCIRYLSGKGIYRVSLVDDDQENLDRILAVSPEVEGVRADAKKDLLKLIEDHDPDVVVCLLPAALSAFVAKVCVEMSVSMTSASYVKQDLRELDGLAKKKDITLLCEMGLDPGIDHMSACKTISEIHSEGGQVKSFWSVCGSLPDPSDNNNPFGYKLSWAPSSVIDSAQREACIIKNRKVQVYSGGETFCHPSLVEIEGLGWFEQYANGDSTPYVEAYGMEEVEDVHRGTLRYIGWSETVRGMLNLGLFSTDPLKQECRTRSDLVRYLTGIKNVPASEAAGKHLNLDNSSAVLMRLQWLGLFEDEAIPTCCKTPKDVVSDLFLKKLVYEAREKDIVVMQHRYGILFPATGRSAMRISTLLDRGEIGQETSISRTTGLPLAIGTHLLLQGKIKGRGVVMPTTDEIYGPVLEELASYGLVFKESSFLSGPGTG